MRGPIAVLCLAVALFTWRANHAAPGSEAPTTVPTTILEAPPSPISAAEPATVRSPAAAGPVAVASAEPDAIPSLVPAAGYAAVPAAPAEPGALQPEPSAAREPRALAPWPARQAPISTAGAFLYLRNHAPTPLPVTAFAAMAGTEAWPSDDGDAADDSRQTPLDLSTDRLRLMSRSGLCSTIASVARANDLPIPFFANLIWQESSFDLKSVSTAGALGIAQFIPETAYRHGLFNPFEPMQALFASGKLLRKLNHQFGNLGLAAAAYNAGPERVKDALAARRTLPGETLAYVVRITGRPADQWLSSEIRHNPEATLMPAKAPCPEVKEAVKEQAKIVGVAKLIMELAAATAPPPADDPAAVALATGARPATMMLKGIMFVQSPIMPKHSVAVPSGSRASTTVRIVRPTHERVMAPRIAKSHGQHLSSRVISSKAKSL